MTQANSTDPRQAGPRPDGERNPLSPRKLLLSKWTAVTPRQREKHFIVVGVVAPDPPGSAIVQVDLEAVHSRRSYRIDWRELTDASQWRQGWA